MQESIFGQCAKSAALFGVQYLREKRRLSRACTQFGVQFSISDDVVELIEKECLNEIRMRHQHHASDFSHSEEIPGRQWLKTTERLFELLITVGRDTTCKLLGNGKPNDSRFKVVDGVLVLK